MVFTAQSTQLFKIRLEYFLVDSTSFREIIVIDTDIQIGFSPLQLFTEIGP